MSFRYFLFPGTFYLGLCFRFSTSTFFLSLLLWSFLFWFSIVIRWKNSARPCHWRLSRSILPFILNSWLTFLKALQLFSMGARCLFWGCFAWRLGIGLSVKIMPSGLLRAVAKKFSGIDDCTQVNVIIPLLFGLLDLSNPMGDKHINYSSPFIN